MKEIKKMLPLTVMSLAIVALTAGALNTYAHFANRGDKEGMNFDPAKMEEMRASHEAMQTALENNDFAAWQAAVSQEPMFNGKLGDQITEENFNVMVQVHRLMKEGKAEEARQLMEDSGLKMGFMGKGFRLMGGMRDFKLKDANGDGYCEPAEQAEE